MRCGKPAIASTFYILLFLNFPAHSDSPPDAGRRSAQQTRTVDAGRTLPHSPAPVREEGAASDTSTALPLPRPPADGETSAETTRLTVHQENARWTRATTFQRVAGRWIIASDALRAKPPLHCHANPPECDTLPP